MGEERNVGSTGNSNQDNAQERNFQKTPQDRTDRGYIKEMEMRWKRQVLNYQMT